MSETVGVVGVGRMGLPIVGHLARAGFRTLATDLDSTRQPGVEQKTALWRPDAASLARECDIILVCVGLDREVRELLAPGGALRSARRPRSASRSAWHWRTATPGVWSSTCSPTATSCSTPARSG